MKRFIIEIDTLFLTTWYCFVKK